MSGFIALAISRAAPLAVTMIEKPDGFRERDAQFQPAPDAQSQRLTPLEPLGLDHPSTESTPRTPLHRRAARWLRDAAEIVMGERWVRRWFPKYPQRPPNFFNNLGQPHYHGHRERLRQRFLATWPDGLPDYELLELVLFNATPRIDVKPLAKKLIETFGSLNAVVAAPEQRLRMVAGVDDKVVVQLRLVAALAGRLASTNIKGRCVLSSWAAVLDYCRTTMAFQDREQFRVLYLDSANHLIEDVLFAEGTVNHTPVYPREVVARGLAASAVSLILIHNHPSGNPTPSDADIVMTKKIRAACDAVSLRLLDHIIIGKGSESSFRTLGHLR